MSNDTACEILTNTFVLDNNDNCKIKETYIDDIAQLKAEVENANDELSEGKLILQYGFFDGAAIHAEYEPLSENLFVGNLAQSREFAIVWMVGATKRAIKAVESKMLARESVDNQLYVSAIVNGLTDYLMPHSTLLQNMDIDKIIAHTTSALDGEKLTDDFLSEVDNYYRYDAINNILNSQYWEGVWDNLLYEVVATLDDAAENIAATMDLEDC